MCFHKHNRYWYCCLLFRAPRNIGCASLPQYMIIYNFLERAEITVKLLLSFFQRLVSDSYYLVHLNFTVRFTVNRICGACQSISRQKSSFSFKFFAMKKINELIVAGNKLTNNFERPNVTCGLLIGQHWFKLLYLNKVPAILVQIRWLNNVSLRRKLYTCILYSLMIQRSICLMNN